MPLVSDSLFSPGGLYKNGHFSTIYPSVFGKKPNVPYYRERLTLSDGDFIDIDLLSKNQKRLMILCHGLEGSSSSIYMLIFSEHFHNSGWDILSMNYRGCSGVMNKALTMYNSGTTGDLHECIIQKGGHYDEIALVGFSLGGNLVLKYLGEKKYKIQDNIISAVAISVPMHLSDASQELQRRSNFLYQLKFLKTLTQKVREKKKQFPDQINLDYLRKVDNLYDFDNYYTAPLFGYIDAEDYYAQNQSIQWLGKIEVPALIVNAKNDPFLGPLCYPYDIADQLENVYLMTPEHGGHVGFAYPRNDRGWILSQVSRFLKNFIDISTI